jgi:hypothetical protein
MTAFNVVRFRVKPDREEDFIEAHRQVDAQMRGLRSAALVKTGTCAYCFVGEWDNFDNIVAARPQMIALLDNFRDALEEVTPDLGVTDPVSGEVVVQLKSAAPRKAAARPKAKPARGKAKAAPKKKKPARKAAAKKRGR